MTRKRKHRLLVQQRLMGACLLLLCALLLWLVLTGTTAADRDGTAVVMLLPLAGYLLTTRKIVIMKG